MKLIADDADSEHTRFVPQANEAVLRKHGFE
jgi:hypothetical protein